VKKGLTRGVIILDKSGSMTEIKKATISAFNEFVEAQKTEPGEMLLDLVAFNQAIEIVFSRKDMKDVPVLSEETYRPHGNTALRDAIGYVIESLGNELAATAEEQRPENVVVVIITDGVENASQRYTSQAKIKEMVAHQQERYAWKFLFFGANQDAVLSGEAIGVNPGQSSSFPANAKGISDTMHGASTFFSALRRGQPPSSSAVRNN
jgi:hypothetical protein